MNAIRYILEGKDGKIESHLSNNKTSASNDDRTQKENVKDLKGSDSSREDKKAGENIKNNKASNVSEDELSDAEKQKAKN